MQFQSDRPKDRHFPKRIITKASSRAHQCSPIHIRHGMLPSIEDATCCASNGTAWPSPPRPLVLVPGTITACPLPAAPVRLHWSSGCVCLRFSRWPVRLYTCPRRTIDQLNDAICLARQISAAALSVNSTLPHATSQSCQFSAR